MTEPNKRCVRATLLRWVGLLVMVVACSAVYAQPPAATLDQIRNGPYDAPISPANWVNGNVNSSQAHMVEGYSLPYRVAMTNMPVGTVVTLILEYDTRHSGANAIDYLTGYNNLEPHMEFWGHPAEVINPLLGYPQLASATENQIPIDPPQNMPTNTFFNNFMAANPGLNYMSLWGAAPFGDSFEYVSEGPLTDDVSSTRFLVRFTVQQSTVVLSWGGHIAKWDDWEPFGEISAGGISGSPYHTRTINWDIPKNNLGNQDRSMQAAVVLKYFTCEVNVTETTCVNSMVYASNIDIDLDIPPDLPNIYEWEIINQVGTNASPLTGTGMEFEFDAGPSPGTLTLRHWVRAPYSNTYISKYCDYDITVNPGPMCSITPLPDADLCPGSTQTYNAPEGAYTYLWSITGNATIDGSTAGQSVSVIAGSGCGVSYTLTLKLTDDAGCESECSQTYWVRDLVPPVIVDIDDIMLQGCNTAWPAAPTTTFTDNCTEPYTLTGVPGDVMTDGCYQYIDYAFNVTDDCDNEATEVIVRVTRMYDETPPVIVDIDDIMLQGCNTAWPAAPTTTFTDNCTEPYTLTGVPGDVMTDGCYQYIDYAFNVTDDCDNEATEVIVRVTRMYDETPPVIVDIDDIMLQGCNTAWPAAPTTTFTDNCTEPYTLTGVPGDVMTDGCYQYIDYAFNVTDDCDNEATEVIVRVTRMYDETPPVIVDIDDIMLQGCNTAWPAAPTTTFTDNCTEPYTLTGVPGDVMTDGCYQYIDYAFNVTDDCDNEATEVIVRVTRMYDETPPVIVDIDDIMLQGCNTPWPAVVETTWTDNCTDGGTVEGVPGEVVTEGCYQTREYTFTVQDECGNDATASVVITRMYDVTDPVIVEVPDYSLQGCNTPWPAVVETTWTDNCTDGGTVEGVPGEVVTEGCYQTREYTFTVQDECGNDATASVVITRMYDVTDPVIVEVPDYSLQGCNTPWPAVVETTWTDNCTDGGTVEGVPGEVVTEGCYQTREYTFTVQDECGNDATASVVITRMYDVTDPVIVEVPDYSLQGCNTPWPAVVETTWTDNCTDGGTVEGVPGEVVTEGCYQTREYTFTVQDECGNDATASVVITRMYDVTDPVIVEVPDYSLQGCNTPWPAVVETTWTDNCTDGGTVEGVPGEVVTEGCYQTREYTFTVQDECGNDATASVVITRMYDVTDPVIVEVPDYSLQGCNTPWPAVVETTWTDNCTDGGTVEGVPGEVVTEGCYQTREYTFTVQDECGNDATASVVITRMYDVTDPVIVEVPDYSLQGCNTPWPAVVETTWTDNCTDGGTVEGVPGEVVTEGCYQTREYTFTVQDECGNDATASVVITRMYDVTDPVIVEVPDYSLQGCNTPWPAVVETTWTDNCTDGGTVEGVPGEVVTEGCYQTREYTFTVQDECGNDATASVVITRMYDVTDPVIVEVPDYSLQGCNTPWPAVVETTWTDNCTDGGTVEGVPGEVVTEGCYQTREYTFTVQDECGNDATASVVITRMYDVTDPVIVEVPDYSLQGCNTPWPAVVETTWTDNCTDGGTVEGVPGEVVTEGCYQTREYTFTVQDECGNDATASVVITRMYDVTDPVIVEVPDYSLQGCNTPWPAVVETTWTDNCTDGGTVEGVPGEVVTEGCYQTREYTFTVQDECGNDATASVVITRMYDVTDPVIVEVPDYSLQGCNTPWPAVVETTWTDNCTDGGTVEGVPGEVVTEGCYQTREYTFTVQDECGNDATASVVITRMYDVTDPVIVEVPDYSLQGCNTPWPAVVETTWTDNCTDGGTVEGVPGEVVTEGCYQTREYTFTVQDECGNDATASVVITRMYDVTDPVIVEVPDYSLQGCNTPWPAVVETTWTDNCTDGGTVEGVPGEVVTEGCYQTREYTFTVQDECGNDATASVVITRMYDVTDPVIVEVPDYSLQGCNTPWPAVVETTWTDNCTDGGTVEGVPGEVVTEGCYQTREYTFTVQDECGNDATASVVITRMYDVTDPVIVEVPDYSLQGCNTPWPAVVETTWTDNCADGGTVEGVPGEVVTEGCYQTREYTFTVQDECGNDATTSVVITRMYDVTDPEIVEVPDYSLQGCNTPWPAVVETTWTDNCADGGTVEGVPGEVVTEGCYQTREYTFTVQDECGNDATASVVITRMYDVTDPVIVEVPDYSLQGCNTPWPAVVETTWTDNCTDGGTVEGVPGEVVTEGCYQTREYTFTVQDECGNDATASVVITRMYDVTDPVIVEVPDYSLQGCNTPWPAVVETTWTDNCTDGGTVEGVPGEVVTEGCYQTREYTFTVQDECGNDATASVVITRMYDVTDPVIVEVPDYSLQGCNTPWPAVVETTWTDNCADGGTVEGVPGEVVTEGCYQTREYTFTVQDECGNDATTSVVITRMYDVTDPEIVEVPDYSLQGCNTPWPAVVETTWTDNCADGGTVQGVPGEVVTEGCYQTREYTFTVQDDCGNDATASVVITRMYDVTDPVIVEVDDYTLEGCNTAWPAVVETTWTDNCADGGTVQGVPGEVVTEGCYQTREYTFTVQDDCGNDATASVVITRMYDVTDPVIVEVDDYTLEGCNTAWPAVVETTWTDNCADGGTVQGVPGEVVTEGCYQTREYTFTVQDDCGNDATASVVITRMYDVTDPVIVEVDDYTLEGCNTAWPAVVETTWTDNCADGGTVQGVPGEVVTEGCYQTREYTFTVQDDCGNDATASVVITRMYDVTDPVIVEVDDYTLEGCNTAWPAVVETTWTDNCADGGTVQGVPGEVVTEGCYQTREYTFSVQDDCGNDATASVVITRMYDVTDPVIVEVDDYTLEGCNTAWPAVVETTWTDNCADGGTVQGVPGEVVTEGCYQTREYTFTVQDDCGNDATASVVITRMYDVTDPVIVEVPDYSLQGCNTPWPAVVETTWTDNCADGGTVQGVPGEVVTEGCYQTREYTFTVQDDCGNDATASVVITRMYDVTPPIITDLDELYVFLCDEDVVLPTVVFTDCDLQVETICYIPGFEGSCDEYVFMQGSETIVCFYAVDDCGNESEHHCITIRVDCENCTMTQGFYGNSGGLYCDGSTTLGLLNSLLETPLVLGTTNTYTIPAGAGQCVIDILPGGGPSTPLPVGQWLCGNLTGKKGRLTNNLLAQTLTLGLNMRLDAELGSLVFQTSTFFTRESTGCGEEDSEPMLGTEQYFTMPDCIMGLYGGQPTVQDIYDLANAALGGETVDCGLSEITEALGIINDALDECRFIYFTGTPMANPVNTNPGSGAGQKPTNEEFVKMNVSPNPFREEVEIRYILTEDSRVSVEIYNLLGVKVETIYEGVALGNYEYTHRFTPARHRSEQVFLLVMKTKHGVITRRLISTH